MRRFTLFAFVHAAGLVLACVCVPHALSQDEPGTTTVSASVTGVHQIASDLDRGGDVEWSSGMLGAGVTHQFNRAFSGGVSMRYGEEAWRFGSPAAFGGQAPWQDLVRAGVGLSLTQAFSQTLFAFLSPSVEWAYEADANADDAMIYGGVLGVVKVFSPNLILGLGGSVYREFFSVSGSPFIILDWKLTERLRIANALPAGPEGGGGIELRARLSPDWEAAVGGVIRQDRSRLAAGGPYAGKVGEARWVPAFARLSRKLGSGSSLDFYGGALFNGRLRIMNGDGDKIAGDYVQTAPAFAITLSVKPGHS